MTNEAKNESFENDNWRCCSILIIDRETRSASLDLRVWRQDIGRFADIVFFSSLNVID